MTVDPPNCGNHYFDFSYAADCPECWAKSCSECLHGLCKEHSEETFLGRLADALGLKSSPEFPLTEEMVLQAARVARWMVDGDYEDTVRMVWNGEIPLERLVD